MSDVDATSLCPGYKWVEAFGKDEEYEDEDGEAVEEVEYITIDLGLVEPTLVPSTSSYRLIVSMQVYG
jgi:general transcription factor 3C polypeptide 6